ncbi:hypothetical protein [Ferrigenium sp. UT5]|uniref:hypothetical protein n=1 Tax=Ferrigenium sp. UT5 TaxID=3242105 RepID=UPI0038B300A8
MRSVAKKCIEKPNRRWWVRTIPSRTRHYAQANQGCRFYETNKSKDTVLPRLNLPVNLGNLATLAQAKIAKEELQ